MPLLTYIVDKIEYQDYYFIKDESCAYKDGEKIQIWVNPKKPKEFYMKQRGHQDPHVSPCDELLGNQESRESGSISETAS